MVLVYIPIRKIYIVLLVVYAFLQLHIILMSFFNEKHVFINIIVRGVVKFVYLFRVFNLNTAFCYNRGCIMIIFPTAILFGFQNDRGCA
jgi:hypothetical protein